MGSRPAPGRRAAPRGLRTLVYAAGPRCSSPMLRSSRARITADTSAPCVLASERASHPGDEQRSAKPSSVAAVLLDTTVLIDVLRGRSGARERLLQLRVADDEAATCAINVEEVVRGLRPREAASRRTSSSADFASSRWQRRRVVKPASGGARTRCADARSRRPTASSRRPRCRSAGAWRRATRRTSRCASSASSTGLWASRRRRTELRPPRKAGDGSELGRCSPVQGEDANLVPRRRAGPGRTLRGSSNSNPFLPSSGWPRIACGLSFLALPTYAARSPTKTTSVWTLWLVPRRSAKPLNTQPVFSGLTRKTPRIAFALTGIRRPRARTASPPSTSE